MPQATTQDIVATLAYLENNRTTRAIAEMAFPDNQHLQETAERYNNRLLAFYGYLDLGNRKAFIAWLDKYLSENHPQ